MRLGMQSGEEQDSNLVEATKSLHLNDGGERVIRGMRRKIYMKVMERHMQSEGIKEKVSLHVVDKMLRNSPVETLPQLIDPNDGTVIPPEDFFKFIDAQDQLFNEEYYEKFTAQLGCSVLELQQEVDKMLVLDPERIEEDCIQEVINGKSQARILRSASFLETASADYYEHTTDERGNVIASKIRFNAAGITLDEAGKLVSLNEEDIEIMRLKNEKAQRKYAKKEKNNRKLDATGEIREYILRCAWCDTQSTPKQKLSCCSLCKNTYYCSKECQTAHWKMHKKVCQAHEK